MLELTMYCSQQLLFKLQKLDKTIICHWNWYDITQCSLQESCKVQCQVILHCYSTLSNPHHQVNGMMGPNDSMTIIWVNMFFDRYFIQMFFKGFMVCVAFVLVHIPCFIHDTLYTYFLILITCKHLLSYFVSVHASYWGLG
jgi:hypothetical protein